MADAWGGAWGAAWGVSWGSGVSPTPTPETPSLGPFHKRRRATQRELRKKIEELYAEERVSEVAEQAAAIVRPFTNSEAEIPTLQAVDWPALKRDNQAIKALIALWIQHLEDEDERDDEIVLFGIG